MQLNKNTHLIIDFDSTIVKLEGLDELAKIVLENNPEKSKIENQIEAITKLGMSGKITFGESLSQRLKLFSPNQPALNKLVELLKSNISDSFSRNKQFIEQNKDQIFVVSGGFAEWVVPVCEYLGFDTKKIFANNFINVGDNFIVNNNNPLSKSKGKIKVVDSLHLNGKIIVIGDGYTDFEITQHVPNSEFILYFENIFREELKNLSVLQSEDFDQVLTIIESFVNINYKINKSNFN